MKRNLLALTFLAVSASAAAQLAGDGYYRVQNAITDRYIRIIDNRGSVNIATTSADLAALQTVRPFDEVVSDPATIIYIESRGNKNYNLIGQGTNAYEMIGYYIKVNQVGSIYRAYQENSVTRIYLNDTYGTSDYGRVLTNDSRTRDWNILPVNSDGDCYFGVKAGVEAQGVHYASFFAGFPFNTIPSGMKVFYVNRISGDKAVYTVLEGTIPASTPVVVACVSDQPAENKVDIVSSNATAPADNLLTGVYFDNDNRVHYNRVAYDPTTMRVLGVCSDGSIGFVTADIEYIPANQTYLTVPAGTPAELRLVEEGTPSAITSVTTDAAAPQGVYSLDGRLLRSGSDSLEGLSRGIYIVNGKKVVIP